MKKFLFISILLSIGFASSAQIRHTKSFNRYKGVYVFEGDTLIVTSKNVTVSGNKYDVVKDGSFRKDYSMILKRNDDEFYLLFMKKANRVNISLLHDDKDKKGTFSVLLPKEAKIK